MTFAAGSGGEGFEMAGPGGEDDKKFLLGLVDKDGETAPESEAGWCNESAGRHVQSFVVQATEGGERVQDGWSAEQVWGFEVIGGSRYWTRRVVCRKGEEGVARARLVYDYKGKA